MRRSPRTFLMRLSRTTLVLTTLLLVSGTWSLPGDTLSTLFSSPIAVAADKDLEPPTQTDSQVSKIVSYLMQREHLSSRKLDDEIGERAMGLFLKNLDPSKVYFYQSDVDEFNMRKDQIDDMISDGKLGFAVEVFNRFLERIDERVQTIDELLADGFDFTIDEDMVTDPDMLEYPKNAEEARDRWRKRLKYNLLVLKSEETSNEEAIEKLTKRYHSFANRMKQFNTQEVVEMFVTAVTSSFDPHTTYFSERTYENFLIQMRLNLEGIGASLGSEDGVTVVKRIVPGGAAARDGRLKVEDSIVSVGQGEEGEMVDVLDMKLDDVVDMIRGNAGTVVRLGVMPAGSNDLTTIKITREKIELKDSEAQSAIFDEGKKTDGSPFRVGVIDLPSFYSDMEGARQGNDDFKSTTRDVRRILDEFKENGVDAVVLDLRRNGGGSLNEAINCTGLFIDRGPVVQVKDSVGAVRPLYDTDAGTAWDGPLVVMTSKFSASASEILAGAIQDYERGLVVGDTTTHGKGTVQSLVNLASLLFQSNVKAPTSFGALKITMQQFYRPSGDSTQKRGVLADLVLPSISDKMDVSESDLDYPLEFDRVPRATFNSLKLVTPKIIEQLREDSQSRRASSEDFADLSEDISRYVEQKEKHLVSLNEEKFLARRKELNAEKEDEKVIESQVNADSTKIERDFYLDEVLAITVDYVELLKSGDVARNN